MIIRILHFGVITVVFHTLTYVLCCHKYILRDTIAATEFLSLERKDKIQINGRSFLAIDFRPALPLFCWSWPFLTFAVAQLGLSLVAHGCVENCLVTGKMDFGSAWGVACSIYSPLIQVPFVIPHFLCQQERVATNTVLSTFLTWQAPAIFHKMFCCLPDLKLVFPDVGGRIFQMHNCTLFYQGAKHHDNRRCCPRG